jgi:hypothetical protein
LTLRGSFEETARLRKIAPQTGRSIPAAPIDSILGSCNRPAKPINETIFGNQRNQTETELAYFLSQQAASLGAPEAHMNHSFHSADRATHLKIVIVALVAGVTVAAFGIAARSNVDYSQTAQSVQVIKAGKPVVVTSSDAMVVR